MYQGFGKTKLRKPQRSLFDLSHEKRMSTRMGKLTPFFFCESLPGDTFRFNARTLLRFAPMTFSVMHSFTMYLHLFKVPIRLLWADSELFFTGGRLGTETPPVPPNSLISTIQGRAGQLLNKSKVSDYLGLNPIADADVYTGRTIDLLPFAGWYKVWYDYYRDRNFVADDAINAPLPLLSGTTASTSIIDKLTTTRYRDWMPDYFTTALPWTQRGNIVMMPLVGSGNVTYLPQSIGVLTAGGEPADGDIKMHAGAGSGLESATSQAMRLENIDAVALTGSAVSINDFRKAEKIQEYLERNALAGSRYFEWTLAHFAVRGSDARLQRAEYLGGRKIPVNIQDTVASAWSVDGASNDIPQGQVGGYSKTFGETETIKFYCEEHCLIYGVLSIMPTTAYMQGSHRAFFGRNTYLDYAIPLLAHLGEQPVYKYELYSDPTNLPVARVDQPVLGYQSRFADWKHIASSSHGDFRDTLFPWHMTRKFASSPVLGTTFLTFDDALQDHIFNVSGTDTMWLYIYNQVTVSRALPYFGTPEL